LYQGNKAVFEGLWIENNWDWTKIHPVLHFSFDDMTYRQVGLTQAIEDELYRLAALHEIELEATNFKGKFKELIQKLSDKQGKVVVLIDEYDKPIIDFLETATVETAKANRDVLREFYGILKNADEHLELVFITGISKFSKVSIFSHLNNLKDISLSKNYAALTGYTQEELEFNFAEHIQKCAESLEIDKETLLQHMKIWYNGYSWDGKTKVYNPFGTLNFLDDQAFKNYWFSTGSPRFLIEQMRTQALYNVENSVVNNTILDKYDLDNLTLIPLLFQSGYLTVKSSDPMTGDLVLDYPNKEVRESMYQFLIDDLSRNQQRTHTGMTINELKNAFVSRDLEQVQSIINALLADLPSETYLKQTEGLYHGLIHLIFKYLGVFVDSEVHSSQGRADAIVQTLTDVYVFEFKFNKTAQAGIDQINKKNYATKYKASGKMITGIGVNFDSEIKQINDWMEVIL
jgi:hypothetical protein